MVAVPADLGRRPDPAAMARWCRDQHELLPGLPLWVVENGLCTRVRNGRNYPRSDGLGPASLPRPSTWPPSSTRWRPASRYVYLHWSLVDNYEWGSYEPRFGIFGIDRSRGPRGFRWLDTDSDGGTRRPPTGG